MSIHEAIPMKSPAITEPARLTPAPFGTLQRKCACGGSAGAAGGCDDCKKKKILQRSRGMGASSAPGHSHDGGATAPASVHDVLRSPGQPLDPAARTFFEPRFGHDFSRVRVHADSRAAQSAAAVNAVAYTLGNDLAFGAGQYAPSTEGGRRLLAHELAHVVQQAGATNAASSDLRVGAPGDAAETEAERVAEAVTRAVAPSRHAEGSDGSGHLKQPGVPLPSGQFAVMLRRTVVVNPAAAAPDIQRQFNVLCPGKFAVSGSNITDTCAASTNQSCECLCDVAHDPARTYTLNVTAATVGTESKVLFDGTTATVPSVSTWPATTPGPNPTVNLVASGSAAEFGSFAPDGHAEWAEDWRILEHELCGHARLGGGDGPIGNRPAHDTTINTENAIAAEQGRPARGHFADRRQGESFFNAAGNRSKVRFTLTNGIHFEAP